MNNQSAKGFTLIEILIALSIFVIIATLTSSSMYYAFNTRNLLTKQANRLSNLQLAITIFSRDTEQIVNRAIRIGEQLLLPGFIGNNHYVEFTRGGVSNPLNQNPESYLRRIAYLCNNNQLIRRSWRNLDTTNRNNFYDKILLKNLTYCEFNFLNQSLNLLSEWRENAVQQNQKKEPLPKAIKLSFSMKHAGKFNQLFILPQALYAEIY